MNLNSALANEFKFSFFIVNEFEFSFLKSMNSNLVV